MTRNEQNHEKSYSNESSLKSSLQADLAKSGETYKHQKNKFEQLQIQANQLQQKSLSNPKPPIITFKKLKSQSSNQSSQGQK